MAARKSIPHTGSFIITSRTFYNDSFITIGTAFIELTLDQQAAGMNEHGRRLNVIRHTVERDFIVQMYAGLTNHPESCTYSDAVIMAVIGMETSQFSTRVYTQM